MTSIAQVSHLIQSALTRSAEKAAKTMQLIKRQRKVTPTNLAQTLVLGWWQDPDISCEGLTAVGESVGLSITPQGLDKRFNPTTACYLQQILNDIVSTKVSCSDLGLPQIADKFRYVYVEDSSIVTLPDDLFEIWQGFGGSGSRSSVKLQTRLDLQHGTLDGPHLVDGRVHDRKAADAHDRNETKGLLLQDLGYWSLKEWEKAEQQDSYRVSYFKMSTHFWHDGQPYDAHSWCRTILADEFEIDILLGKSAKIPMRLIGRRAPKSVAEERRRKLKRGAQTRGQPLSKQRLELCEWTLIVTNVPTEIMSAEEAFVWVGVRWQIELLFKLWKSVGKIDKSRSENPWRQLCEFYAKLIAMTLQHWVFLPTIWHYPNRSLTKAAKLIQKHVIRLLFALKSKLEIGKVIEEIRMIVMNKCRINRSRKQVRTFQQLENLAVEMA